MHSVQRRQNQRAKISPDFPVLVQFYDEAWKTVWSAGQSVGLIHEISSCEKIMQDLVREYDQVRKSEAQLK